MLLDVIKQPGTFSDPSDKGSRGRAERLSEKSRQRLELFAKEGIFDADRTISTGWPTEFPLPWGILRTEACRCSLHRFTMVNRSLQRNILANVPYVLFGMRVSVHKLRLSAASLIVAIPGAFLVYLLAYEAFMQEPGFTNLSGFFQIISGLALAMVTLMVLMPAIILIFGPKDDSDEKPENAKAGKSREAGGVAVDGEPGDAIDEEEVDDAFAEDGGDAFADDSLEDDDFADDGFEDEAFDDFDEDDELK